MFLMFKEIPVELPITAQFTVKMKTTTGLELEKSSSEITIDL